MPQTSHSTNAAASPTSLSRLGWLLRRVSTLQLRRRLLVVAAGRDGPRGGPGRRLEARPLRAWLGPARWGGTAGRSAVSGEACGRVVSALLRRNASARGPCPSSSSYAPVVVRPRPQRRLCEEERVFAQLALPDARRPRLWEVAQPLPTKRRHLRRLDARIVEQMDGCGGAPVALDDGGGWRWRTSGSQRTSAEWSPLLGG